MDDIRDIIYKHALLNAAKHKGNANPKAVMGSIMSQEAELRSKAKEIGQLLSTVVDEVNNLSVDEQKTEMEKYDVKVEAKKPAKPKEKGLGELPGAHEMLLCVLHQILVDHYILDIHVQQYLMGNLLKNMMVNLYCVLRIQILKEYLNQLMN